MQVDQGGLGSYTITVTEAQFREPRRAPVQPPKPPVNLPQPPPRPSAAGPVAPVAAGDFAPPPEKYPAATGPEGAVSAVPLQAFPGSQGVHMLAFFSAVRSLYVPLGQGNSVAYVVLGGQ